VVGGVLFGSRERLTVWSHDGFGIQKAGIIASKESRSIRVAGVAQLCHVVVLGQSLADIALLLGQAALLAGLVDGGLASDNVSSLDAAGL
jgi:hypothetical protein